MTAQDGVVQSEGGLFPGDLLERVGALDPDLPCMRAADYHLAAEERLGDAALRKWQYLRGVYKAFRDKLADHPENASATTLTRERWLLILLDELGFGRVPALRGRKHANGREYQITHEWQHVPMCLVDWNESLDRAVSSGRRAPQTQMQGFLNASDEHLWGIVSNGRRLRLVRDSTNLVGAAYVEFDLEAIFDGELFPEFRQLFCTAHVSRFELTAREPGTEPGPSDCPLERWLTEGQQRGARARERLWVGLRTAMAELGTGLLSANRELRDELARRQDGLVEFHHELLRVMYQVVFCLVAEDRDALLLPDLADRDHDERGRRVTEAARRERARARERYDAYFSTGRLRRIARNRTGDPANSDLWQTLRVVLTALGADNGRPELALPGLGGLFPGPDERPAPDLVGAYQVPNAALLRTVRELTNFRGRDGLLNPVDFRAFDADELGSVYEKMLELVPQHDGTGRFWLEEMAGSTRKTTGSYYTPAPLISALLDTTLEPVLNRFAEEGGAQALLRVRVCDPACGSGDFLVAAARRIAKKYVQVASGDDEPAPAEVAKHLPEVVRNCLYGVDVNELSAELAKVSLWLASIEPGRPLAFLDAHIKSGNSLLGATPKQLETGIPDDAFKPLDGDDKAIVSALRKRNAIERPAHRAGGDVLDLDIERPEVAVTNKKFADETLRITTPRPASLPEARVQTLKYRDYTADADLSHRRLVADAWCAAFVWPRHKGGPEPLTTKTVRNLDAGTVRLTEDQRQELAALSERYRFFHWHLEFPEIFRVDDEDAADLNEDTRWHGGFDCVIGNPPWEKIEFKEQEFFEARAPEIARAKNAAKRKAAISRLQESDDQYDRDLYRAYRDGLRKISSESHFLRTSGRYPETGEGRLNTYAVFAETARTLIAGHGFTGQVLPTGIATDATTAPFFSGLVRSSRLAAFLEFENEAFLLSKDVHHSFRFCLLTACGRLDRMSEARFAFSVRYLADLPERQFTMPADELLLVNPNTGTAPVFSTRRDADIILGIYRRVPVLWRETPRSNPWGLSFMQGLFNMASNADLFHTREDLESDGWKLRGNIFAKDGERMLPLVEAKMIHHFDHRYGTYEGQTEAQANMGTLPRLTPDAKRDPSCVTLPRYWIEEQSIAERLDSRGDRGWLLGWRKICRSSDERTLIPAAFPISGFGDSGNIAFSNIRPAHFLVALLSSRVMDYVLRQKMAGTNLNYFLVKQLPVLPPQRFEQETPWDRDVTLDAWITPRVKELTYTAWDMEPFARDLGDENPPFIWDDERRFWLRAELDTAFFHLYGVARDDVAYILDTFRAFRNNDQARFDRTRSAILGLYDVMASAAQDGAWFRSNLTPPPGEGPRHPAGSRPDWLPLEEGDHGR